MTGPSYGRAGLDGYLGVSSVAVPRAEPAALSPIPEGFVGRRRELDRVGALLMGPARLVTLIGPGGIGKTRLAEEAARRLHRARHTPVFAVRLAQLARGSDAAAVREAVAADVLVGGFVGASAWDGAVQTLSQVDGAGRAVDTVLVVDNCEHVLAGAGQVIADLLDAVAGLTILATSREPVGWVDEQLVTVPPLSGDQSVELFRQRAALVGHAITEPDQVGLAQQICRRMHGHPLCIRLAAARMLYEPLSTILKQLSGESDDARMRWRHGPRAGAEGRHRSITDVIAWSYELCSDKQRLLFDRLSVFAPGHDTNPEDLDTVVADVGAELEAIEAVCADDVSIPGCDAAARDAEGDQAAFRLARAEIRELLERLVEQSLVSIHISAYAVRYSLLESLRLFASERLAERSTEAVDEPARLARRHYYHYRDKALHAQAEWFGTAEQELLTWAMGAWPNIRRAIDASLAAREPVVALQICVGLLSLRAPFYIGSLAEIRGRIEQALATTQASQKEPAEFQLAALALTAWLALVQGCPQDAEELLDRCVASCNTKSPLGERWRDEPETDVGLPAVVDYAWGAELLLARRDPRAIAVFARAREKFHEQADRGGEAMSEMFEAMAAGFFGPAKEAMAISQRHLERTTAAGAKWAATWAQMMLALALIKSGDAEAALELVRAALTYQVPMGDQWGTTWSIHVRIWALARLVADQMAAGNAGRSMLVKSAIEIAYVAGGLKSQRARVGVLIENMGPFADETSAAEKVAREVLGRETYADLEKRGSRLSPGWVELQRVALGALAIDVSSGNHRAAEGRSSWATLSKAEHEVAVLAAAGWPNSAIGVRRGTSTKTVDAQMSSIFQKLTINSREDIVRFVPRELRRRISQERSHLPRHGRDKP
ncbi:helix-turn-helix transcriptional regulator [Mycobacterium heidelbergense]|uniref:helix-turn-helix transcriptional regulator n=1 Tax=Mycobacterium heidelbergense TaxID=53376 RepID=UPI003CE852ED